MMQQTPNPYLTVIYRNLPRLLAMYDRDSASLTYGVGDRLYWAWKLIDFPNGTYQGAVSGLAALYHYQLLPSSFNKASILQRISAMMVGLKSITAKNGSLDEALPNEASFCVTGLVANDVLHAVSLLKHEISSIQCQEWIEIAKPLIHFLYQQDEMHGLISNHLATCALALVRWADCCEFEAEKANKRARVFIQRIIDNQSLEGFFKEYEGADPGYQTWCLASLVEIDNKRPEWGLKNKINDAIQFLTYAAHPNGSFGGAYGSRMTRFVFPSAFEKWASTNEDANALTIFFQKNILEHQVVTLDAIDSGNLIPLFNDYVMAAIYWEKNNLEPIKSALPHEQHFSKYLKDSGLYIYSDAQYYAVINVKKSGMGLLYCRGDGKMIHINPPYYKCNNKRVLAGGHYFHDVNVEFIEAGIRFNCMLRPKQNPLPSAFKFMVLRGLSLTVFKSLTLGNWVKQLLARYLMRSSTSDGDCIVRTMSFTPDFSIKDEAPENYIAMDIQNFKPIHMASQGYWQMGDDV